MKPCPFCGDVLWRITLNVCSFGKPEICYTYTGKTFAEALDKAVKDIDDVIGELGLG